MGELGPNGNSEVFSEPLTTGFSEKSIDAEKPDLEQYLSREKIVQLTNLFDELAKKYEDMTTDSDNGLAFGEELQARIDQIFEGEDNNVVESVRFAFGHMGNIAENNLAFALEEERANGAYMSPKEEVILEWFDQQKQKDLLFEMVKWQQETMRMTQWLNMTEGGQELVLQFYERWRQFAGKRLGVEDAESQIRGIQGPLIFAQLCDEAGFDVYLPEVAWDRDQKIDFFIKDKNSNDLVFATQMKAKRNGRFGIQVEDESEQSHLGGKALKEKERLVQNVARINQSWQRNHGIELKPLFVTIEGLNGNDDFDMATGRIKDENLKQAFINQIREKLGSEEELLKAA